MRKVFTSAAIMVALVLVSNPLHARSQRGHGPQPNPKYPIKVVPNNPNKPHPAPMPDAGKAKKMRCPPQNPCKT